MASQDDFNKAFALIVGIEGGYVNDPNDPGGETKYGISKRSYPNVDIASLSLEDAEAIYQKDFWVPAGCPDMPPRLAFVVLDCAINNGVTRAIMFLQQTLNLIVDGELGPVTRAAIQRAATANETGIAVDFHAYRLRYMVELGTWPTYRGGWSKRLANIPFQAALTWPPDPAAPSV
jgi:lysozyme family protein